MNKLVSALVAMVLASLLVTTAQAASNTVCKNLKLMIAKQQNTLKHYKDVHATSRIDIKQSQKNIVNYGRTVKESQAKVDRLRKQLTIEQAKLDKVQHQMDIEKRRLSTSTHNLKTITQSVIENEQELIQSLDQQYQQMCVAGNSASDSSNLTNKYYP